MSETETETDEYFEHLDAAKNVLFADASGVSTSAHSSSSRTDNTAKIKLRKAVEFRAAAVGGCLLSINAGCINAITVLETGFAVSHLTGATTNAAIAIAEFSNFTALYKYLGIILSFVFGGILTGLLGGNYDEFKLGHSYGRVLVGCFFFLLLAMIDEVIFPNSYSYMFLCAIACGMQNSMTTKFSGNMIRTTHVTGALTDIGLTIGRMLRGRKELSWKLGLLCPMTACFFAGALLGGGLHPFLGRYTLTINISVFALAGTLYIVYFARAFQESYFNIITGQAEFIVLTDDNELESDDVFDFSEVENYRRSMNGGKVRHRKRDIEIGVM